MAPRSRTHGHLARGGRCLRLAALKRGVPSSARWLLRTGATVSRGKDLLACVRYRTDALATGRPAAYRPEGPQLLPELHELLPAGVARPADFFQEEGRIEDVVGIEPDPGPAE